MQNKFDILMMVLICWLPIAKSQTLPAFAISSELSMELRVQSLVDRGMDCHDPEPGLVPTISCYLPGDSIYVSLREAWESGVLTDREYNEKLVGYRTAGVPEEDELVVQITADFTFVFCESFSVCALTLKR